MLNPIAIGENETAAENFPGDQSDYKLEDVSSKSKTGKSITDLEKEIEYLLEENLETLPEQSAAGQITTIGESQQSFGGETEQPNDYSEGTWYGPEDQNEEYSEEDWENYSSEVDEESWEEEYEGPTHGFEYSERKTKKRFENQLIKTLSVLKNTKNPELVNAASVLPIVQYQVLELIDKFNEFKESTEATVSKEKRLRQECEKLESELGIQNEYEKMLEASLFIDPPFIKAAILRGDEHPEELFGLDAWKGWLEARVKTREMEKLSVENIIELHKILTQGMPKSFRGIVREKPIFGTDYTNQGTPVRFDDMQKKAINENPLLKLRTYGDDDELGVIVYPSTFEENQYQKLLGQIESPDLRQMVEVGGDTASLIHALLEESVQKFERSRVDTTGESIRPDEYKEQLLLGLENTARLQREIVSIHPFRDGNGRLSRLLMQWAAEKQSGMPVYLEDFDKDLYYTADEWSKKVTRGTGDYTYHFMLQQEEQLENPFYTENEIQFYNNYYGILNIQELPDRLLHEIYRDYVRRFDTESREFSAQTTLVLQNGMVLGGLISDNYMRDWGDTNPKRIQELRNKYFMTEYQQVRGGECSDLKHPEDILRLFQFPVGFTSSYHTLFETSTRPTSLRRVQKDAIENSIRFYNDLISYSYFSEALDSIVGNRFEDVLKDDGDEQNKKKKELFEQQARIEDFLEKINVIIHRIAEASSVNDQKLLQQGKFLYGRVLDTHSKADAYLAVSPAVSGTTSMDVGYSFLSYISGSAQKRLNPHSILIEYNPPKKGGIDVESKNDIPILEESSFGMPEEQEFLVMGAIDPNSINKVKLYDQETGDIIAEAQREEDGTTITFTNFRDTKVTKYRITSIGMLKIASRRFQKDDTKPVESIS